ncbi:uncharacterized protein LOC120342279 isoform X2 [Styela clava]
MAQSKNIKRWIDRINSSSSSDSVIVDALLKIRPFSKRQSGINDILCEGGIECFLKLIQRPNKKILDVTISILANCLTEDIIRKKVSECQGIPSIVKVLQTIKHPTIITRTCRSIANLANNLECSKTIHGVGTAELILKLIKYPTTTEDCVSSALRAIKNLANTTSHRKKLIQNNAVHVLTKCFNSDTNEVVSSAIRALAAISQSCTIEFADHMLSNDGESIRKLVHVVRESKEDSEKDKSEALSILINLTLQGCARPMLGNSGALECIVDELKNILGDSINISRKMQGPLQENSFRIVGALCYCCREAINRARLRSMDALSLFIRLLSDNRWITVHNFILTSLLCFVYDEVGLKILHDSGIFNILLNKLKEYTIQEQRLFSEQNTSSKAVKMIWDGHGVDDNEKFDRRHSLSCDVPTRFNQRPNVQKEDENTNDIELTFRTLTEFELEWRSKFEQTSCSPQWSPQGPSPIPGDFAEESTPPDTPTVPRSISPSDIISEESHHFPHEVFEEENEPLDQDESSSSRDGFDQMHSPALLPMTNAYTSTSAETSNTEKRNRHSSSSSNGSNSSNEKSLTQIKENKEFRTRMEKDLRQVSKRAKIDNLKENDRIRSRSLDNDNGTTSSNIPVNIQPIAGSSSPSAELTLPDIGNSACSPSFLQFVSDTCSVSPLVLKHAGRDVGTSTSSTTGATSASSWKQNRRRKSSGAVRRLDETDTTNTQEITEDFVPQQPTTSTTDQNAPELTKTMSNPLPSLKEKATPADHTKDCALTGPEPVTPIQVILCLLCHYCEVSDAYVTSLAQQENCTDCMITYIREYPGKLDPKLNRIIDRLTSCPDCFHQIVTSLLVTCVDAEANKRMINKDTFDLNNDSEDFCTKCNMTKTSEYKDPLSNMWHNISLSHSSVYGANTLKRMITKGTDSEAIAATSIVVLLSLWCSRSLESRKNMSDSLLKYVISNLRTILDRKKLYILCDAIINYASTNYIFQSASYTLHKLAGHGNRINGNRTEVENNFDNESPDLFEICEEKLDHEDLIPFSILVEGKGTHENVSECAYSLHCSSSEPDRNLIFTSGQSSKTEKHQHHHNTRARKMSSEKKNNSSQAVSSIPIHSDIISGKSPMFGAMLSGKYRESTEKKVTIRDVLYDAALYIIHNMYGCDENDCTVMRNIMSEVISSSDSRYSNFIGKSCNAGQQLPVEIEILKVLDAWLLQDKRTEFYKKYKGFFNKHYMEREIAVLKSQKENQNYDITGVATSQILEEDVSFAIPKNDFCQNSSKLSAQPHGTSSNASFFLFAINHNFTDITHDFVSNLLRPCFFNHNHECHGKVFASISKDCVNFTEILSEELSKALINVVDMFENVRSST